MKSFLLVASLMPATVWASLTPAPYGGASPSPSGYLGECPASQFEHLVGESARMVKWLAQDNSKVRVVVPGSAYTMEYVPDRLNIHLDREGIIERVSCG